MIYVLSGGAGLNLKVVGNPQPLSPKGNTVWVNTDTEIKGYAFSSTEPYKFLEEIFTDEGMTNGVYLDSAGGQTLHDSFALTDNISLPEGTRSVKITASSTSTSTAYHGFYNASGELVSAVLRQTGVAEYPVPDGAVSIRVSLRTDDTESVIAIGNNAPAGFIWFQTTASSSAAMNIDKKNTVMLYPGGCSQYIGGAWVEKDAQSYLNGEWVDWRIYFYNRGDECTDLTGGWLAMGNLANSSGQGTAITPTITRNADSMLITFKGAQYGVGHVYTQNRIDLTEFKTITIEGEAACTNTNPSIVAIEAEPVQGKYVPTVASVDLPKTGAFKTALDVSALSGGHFIAVKFYNTASATSSVTMSEFYGEV